MPNFSFDLGPLPAGCAADPPIQPREWQSQLVHLLRARLLAATPQGQDVLVHAGPGAGKTLGALLGFQRLQREGRLERLLIFCHRTSIARQWLTTAGRLGVELKEWDPQTGCRGHALLLSYQSAARHRLRLETALLEEPRTCNWLAVADEVHHLGLDPDEPEASAWGHAFSTLTRAASLRLGLTGTPFRADNLAFCAARRIRSHENGAVVERIVPDLCVEPRRLILAGDVRPLEFRFQDGWVEHGRPSRGEGERETSPLSAETRESWRARNLRRAIRPGEESGIARRLLLKARRKLGWMRRGHPGAGGLVIARDIEHARAIGALLSEAGDQVLLAHSQDPDAASLLSAFRGGEADWLVSIDMCAEGFDAPRLRVVVYLTTVVTRSRFVQAITRAVRMDGERSSLEPIPRDASYVFAPADPLLLDFARNWALSEPYRIQLRTLPDSAAPAGGGGQPQPPLQALADQAGSLLRVRGPQLPEFLQRRHG